MDAARHDPLLRAGEGKTVTIGKLSVTYKVTSDQTDDRLGIYEITLAPRTIGATPHFHRVMTEVFHVASGALTLLVGEKEMVAEAGAIVRVPPATVHAFANRGGEPAVFMLSFVPALGREGFFEGLAALSQGGRMSDREAVRDLLQRYDQEPVQGVPGWARDE